MDDDLFDKVKNNPIDFYKNAIDVMEENNLYLSWEVYTLIGILIGYIHNVSFAEGSRERHIDAMSKILLAHEISTPEQLQERMDECSKSLSEMNFRYMDEHPTVQ